MTDQTSILRKISGCIHPLPQGFRCIFYDFDLYKTQKTHENTREDSLHNISVIYILRQSFPERALRCFPKSSVNFQKKNAGNTFEDRSFSRKAPLDVSQRPYIYYLQLISYFTIKYTSKVTEAVL